MFLDSSAALTPLVLHPYYKLDYIRLTWGGAEEQAKERAAGNRNAKNWQDEARKVVENAVSDSFTRKVQSHPNYAQMEMYYRKRPQAEPADQPTPTPCTGENSKTLASEYDRYRQSLLEMDDDHEGWASELRRYLADRPANVNKKTDIVKWWQVCYFVIIWSFMSNRVSGPCTTISNPREDSA